MYEPTFMRQVILAIHTDRVTERVQHDRNRTAAPSGQRVPGQYRRFSNRWLAAQVRLARQFSLSR